MTSHVGAKVKQAREEAALTQAELAKMIKSSERTVRGWESDAHAPRPLKLRLVAKATGKPLAFFMSWATLGLPL